MFDPILFCLTPKKSKTKLLLKPRPFMIFPAFQCMLVCEDNFDLPFFQPIKKQQASRKLKL